MYEIFVERTKKPIEQTPVLAVALVIANKRSRQFRDTRHVKSDGVLVATYTEGVWKAGDPAFSGVKKQPPLIRYHFGNDEWSWLTEGEVRALEKRKGKKKK